MKQAIWRRALKWLSLALVMAGLALGIVGLCMGGLHQVDFFFWQGWLPG